MPTGKWSALGTAVTPISGQSVSAAAYYLGGEVDNTTNRDQWMLAEITWSCATAPTAGRTIELYLILSADGTTYADGGATVTPQYSDRVSPPAVARNVTGTQRRIVRVPVPAGCKFKPLVQNNLDQAATITVSLYPFNNTAV